MKHFTKLFLLLLASATISCSSTSETASTLESRGDVIKHYSSTNYKLIAVEAGIPYGDKIYRWYKGSKPNWMSNRYEKYVMMDLKRVFDTTATFQVIDHGSKTTEIQWTEKVKVEDTNGAFEVVKMDSQNGKKEQIFQGLYREKEVNKNAIGNLTAYRIPLVFPAHHVIRFTGDTLDLFYKNSEAANGSQFMTYSFIRIP